MPDCSKMLATLNCGFKHSWDINRMLENERIGKKLLLMLLDTLIKGFVKKNIR